MAVVRVKRRCDEEPSDILVLACKIRKTENGEPETSVFKLAATVNDQEDKLLRCPHSFKTDAETAVKTKCRNVEDLTTKIRTEHQILSKQSRYKVVNLYRSINENEVSKEIDKSDKIDGDKKDHLTVLDVESNTNSTDGSSENGVSNPKYVYDLYYADDGADFDDLQMEHIDSVHGLGSELMHEYRNQPGYESDPNMEDDDDSNDENNWRNDYPDEEEDYFNDGDCSNGFGDEDDDGTGLMSILGGLKLSTDDDDKEDDLSSDEDIVYNESLDTSDIRHFGTRYAKYKAKINKEEYDSSCSVESESD